MVRDLSLDHKGRHRRHRRHREERGSTDKERNLKNHRAAIDSLYSKLMNLWVGFMLVIQVGFRGVGQTPSLDEHFGRRTGSRCLTLSHIRCAALSSACRQGDSSMPASTTEYALEREIPIL